MSIETRPRVAIVGGGIAGISAAWQLQRTHDVTLYEAAPSLGGHAHAIEAAPGVWLDTGFVIFNTGTYPLFLNFLDELGVRTQAREMRMSFCFSDADRDLHYAVHNGIRALLDRGRNLLKPDFYRLAADLLGFRRRATAQLSSGRIPAQTLSAYLAAYSAPFRENFLIPMAMAIWSLPDEQLEAFPARTLLEFMQNHSLLHPPAGDHDDTWLSFSASSRVYLQAFASRFQGETRLNSPIARIERSSNEVRIIRPDGSIETYDQAVIATHADTALKLLAEPTALERRLLGAWRYQANHVTIHTDATVMPARRHLWSSWNICRADGRYRVSYHLNQVHNLSLEQDYFLSLGDDPIAEDRVIARCDYAHPVFDFAAIATRDELPDLNQARIAFCGSYFGYGFHEDAFRAGIRASAALQGLPLIVRQQT